MEKYRKGVETPKTTVLSQLTPSEIAMPSGIELTGQY
jgi:hypothetical protein